MKCYVCGKMYPSGVCPRCQFPPVQIPNTSWEDGCVALASTITPYRANFLKSINISMVAYHHRDDNGVYVLDHEEEILLGTGEELYGNELWLDQEFARLADQSSVPIRLRLTIGENTREEVVDLPNLHAPELQKIGISMNKEFQIQLKLGNTSEEATCSKLVEV